ncbi:MAG: CPXCG motif-containing cysteine-rich protein [Marinicella sp.]
MNGLETVKIQCPSCWESFATVVDCSVSDQQYVEDCYVCCRPLVIHVQVEAGSVQAIDVKSENE